MQVYGFSYDGGEFCFFSHDEYSAAVVKERKKNGVAPGSVLPGFDAWGGDVPEEVLLQAAYDYLAANNYGRTESDDICECKECEAKREQW